MEYFDLYDIDRKKLDRTIERSEQVPKDTYRMVIHVCIFNSKGEMLIQQRQSFKKNNPNKWDVSVAGCSQLGENSRQSAEREVFEEIGYKIDLTNTRPYFTFNFETGYDDVYIIEADLNLDELKLQYEEVQAAKWATKDEILKLMDEDKFINYYKSFIECLFEMKNYRGVLKK